MDKKTLSHYGWLIIITLILAVMLALATPFGSYVGDATVSFVRGFFTAQDGALDEDNIGNKGDKFDSEFNKVQANEVKGNDCEHKNTVLQNVKEATCGNEGYSGDYYCNDCKQIVIYGKATPTTEHQNIEIQNAIKGSCNTKSFSGNKVCLDCNKIIEKGTYSKNNAHTPEYVGKGQQHSKCSTCGADLNEEHEFVETVLKEPTCSSLGTTLYSCICGYSYSDPNIQTVAHKPVYGGTKGVHEKCTWCNKELNANHTYTVNTGTATCIKEGTTKYTCICGYSYGDDNIAKDPNNHEGTVVLVGTKGVHSKWSCCNKTVETSHNYKITTLSNATCNQEGTEQYKCECGYSYNKTIAKTSHDTYSTEGVAQLSCRNCDAWIIPDGGAYVTGITYDENNGEYNTSNCLVLYEGEEFPKTATVYDIYVDDEYIYMYGAENRYTDGCPYDFTIDELDIDGYGWYSSIDNSNSWGIDVINTKQTTYNKPYTVIGASNLTSMDSTYYDCVNLLQAPNIPNTVTDMYSTFMNCSSLTNLPKISNAVKTISRAFMNCDSLSGILNIDVNPSEYSSCFYDTAQKIYLTGSSSILSQLAATDGFEDYLEYDNVRIIVDNPLPNNTLYEVGASNSDGTYAGVAQTSYGLDIIYKGDGLTIPWPTPTQYDMYTDGDYNYCYMSFYVSDSTEKIDDGRTWTDNWSMHIVDNTKISYEPALENINGIIVDYARNAYKDCVNMTECPELPDNLISIQGCFDKCASLTEIPILPNTIREIGGAFYDCDSIVSAGDENSNIKNFPVGNCYGMYLTFRDCDNLETVKNIPDTYHSFVETFLNCPKLKGIIEINCEEVTGWHHAFYGTVEKIYLTGNCDKTTLQYLADSDGYSDFSENDNVRILDNTLIPEGAIYYVQPTSEKLNTCENGYERKIIGDGKTTKYPTPQTGDALVYGDYEYRYQSVCNVWADVDEPDGLYNYWQTQPAGNSTNEALSGWGVRARDNTKVSYSATLNNIAEQPLTNMDMIFEDCYNLTTLSTDFKIPETVVSVYEMFDQCYSLVSVPKNIILHDNIVNAHGMFWECYSLSYLHDNFIVPESVKYIDYMFAVCPTLSDIITINATPDVYENCFGSTENEIYLNGNSNNLTLIAATDYDSYDNVHSLIHNDNLIPEGATYYRGVATSVFGDAAVNSPAVNSNSSATTVLTEGDTFPTPQTGDRYVYNGYEYAFNCYAWNGWDTYAIHYWIEDETINGWGVRALNSTATTYDMSVIEIGNKPIVSYDSTFEDFSSMATLSKFFFMPDTIISCRQMFDECRSMTTLPQNFYIPDSVTLANGTFWECSALTTLPENFYVGENVTDLGNIFSLCYNLTDEITINCNPTIYDNAIYQTQVTGINGSCNAVTKQNIMATK